MNKRVLVVDDNQHIADSLSVILKAAGYDVITRYSAEEAMPCILGANLDLVIADVVMPGMSGIELCTQIHARYPQLPVILLSGNAATEELLQEGKESMGHFVTLIAKPYPPRDLLRIVQDLTQCRLPRAV